MKDDDMAATALEPRDMEWLDKGVLGIQWSDGHKGIYSVRYLRQHCPCAACVDEWTGERRLKVGRCADRDHAAGHSAGWPLCVSI